MKRTHTILGTAILALATTSVFAGQWDDNPDLKQSILNDITSAGFVGTSFSAAHVSGVAALVAAERGNDRGAGAVAEIVVNSADDLGAAGPDDYYGKGRVNALRAVQIGRGDNDDDDNGDDD